MHRREILRQLIFGTFTATSWLSCSFSQKKKEDKQGVDEPYVFKSKWHVLPDMVWVGEDLWPQRLQDWRVKDGELQCVTHGKDRTVHVLTHQLIDGSKPFKANLTFRFLNRPTSENETENFVGLRMGIKGRFGDYRSAIMSGTGFDIGITRSGRLFVDSAMSDVQIDEQILRDFIQLTFSYSSQGIKLEAEDRSGKIVAWLTAGEQEASMWNGNVAMVSHFENSESINDTPIVSFIGFEMFGEGLTHRPDQVYGAVYFAQYTIHANVLKLSAQLAPIDRVGGEAWLFIKEEENWTKATSSSVHPLARVAAFRVEKWDTTKSVQYRVVYALPLRNGEVREFTYEGTVAAEPVNKTKVKALAFSCNWDFGFPDTEVVENALKHQADLALFLGDQFYESNGRFGVQTDVLEKATLDYLRKWIQFGWSYRDLFRHIPMIALPDDHDMYHGNIWGSGGRAAIAQGTDAARQDSGGYKMPAGWVNMAQFTQTSHMPDPYDRAPVGQNINVYYTHWQYAGVSFAIIEDRKFKSAPQDILPDEANIYEGYAQNSFDKSKVKELEAQLVGERQLLFLQHWNNQRDSAIRFKVLVSATPFCCLQTLPRGTKNDEITPSLPIPKKGEYIQGDAMTKDMDSNGWPHNRRNEVLKTVGSLNLHLCGDQHLGSIVQYGTEMYGDNGFCFSVPALCNIWPRRWWPPVSTDHEPLPGQPLYTGNFKDGFGNKVTVYAVANPVKSGKKPDILYDRATGYGVVEFDSNEDQIVLHCFPRFEHQREYDGWPYVISNDMGKVENK